VAKRSAQNPIQKINPGFVLPEYLKDYEQQGTDALQEHRLVPRIKIIQKSASQELLDQFKPGTAISSVDQTLLAQRGEDFKFIPLFAWTDVALCNPIELKGQEPFIVELYSDRLKYADKYEKAKMKSTRFENHPSIRGVKRQWTLFMNFIVKLVEHPVGNELFVMSFFRGEWRTGRRFSTMILGRKAPIWSCIFHAHVCEEPRKNQKGEWWGFDISNDPDELWVPQSMVDELRTQHEDLEELHKRALLATNYEDEHAPSSDVEDDTDVNKDNIPY